MIDYQKLIKISGNYLIYRGSLFALSNKWFKVIDYQEIIKILGNYCFLGEFKGGEALSRRLIFRVDGKIK